MNIEFEMKINEKDEKDNSNLMLSLGNTEKLEVLFSENHLLYIVQQGKKTNMFLNMK